MLRKVGEDFGWQLVMLASDTVVINIRALRVFDDLTLAESEIIVPGTCRENGLQAIGHEAAARPEAVRLPVVFLFVGELRSR